MATPEGNYNPTEAFHRELDAQETSAKKELDMTFEQKMAWFERASKSWAQAANNRIPAVLHAKADQVTDEIKKIEESQIGELNDYNRALLKETQKTIFGSVQERVLLMVEMAAMQAENQPVGSDKTVTTDVELAKLREVETLIERIDVQQLVYNALPAEMQVKYLESVGRQFPTDFYPILKKANAHVELDDKDLTLLMENIRKLGGNKEALAKSSVLVVLSLISPADRTALLTKMAEQDTFPNFEELLLGMVAGSYITGIQASMAIDARKAYLEQKKTTTKRKEDKLIDQELTHLDGTRATVDSDQMKTTQKAALTIRAEASKYYGSRMYGHKNFAADFLTVRGIGSFLLTVNGGLTMFANAAMNATDPLSLLGNSMFWLGAAEAGAGLQWGRGQGGLLPTPTEIAANLIKGSHEEKDDLMSTYTEAMKHDVNNYYNEAHFYASYAERIMLAHKAKKSKFPDRTVPLTLKDIGVNKKEDLPAEFRDLWEHKDRLEAKISEWAEDFSMVHAEAGQKLTEWDTQRAFIEKARADVKAPPMKYPSLDYFEYKETTEQ